MAQQQQQFVTSVPTAQVLSAAPPATRSNYNQTGGKVTGWIQIICGVASMIFGICMWLVITGVIPDPSIGLGHLVVFIYFGWLSVPIWCGVIFIISGSLGAAAKKESTCLIGGYMAMSIVSIFFASGQLFYESIAASVTKCNPSNGGFTYDNYGNIEDNDRYDCPMPEVYYGMHVGSALAAFVQIVVAIAGSVLCCQGSNSCCGGSTPPPTQQVNVVYTNQPQQQAGQQQVHVVTQQQGQPGPYPPGPYPPGPYPPAYAPQQQANYPSAPAPHGYQQKV